MKFKLFLLLSACTFLFTSFIQEAGEDGFYVNEGKTKINKLGCYNFADLSAKFPIKPEMMGYDEIRVVVGVMHEGDQAGNPAMCAAVYINGKIFKSKYAQAKSGSQNIFIKDQQNSVMCKAGEYFNRGHLKYTGSDDKLTTASLQLSVWGRVITGYKEEVVGERIEKTPIFSPWEMVHESVKLPLANREKIPKLKVLLNNKVDLTTTCDPSTE
jgi:hypothetical protein